MQLEAELESRGAERLLHGIKERASDGDRLLSVLSEDIGDYEAEVFASGGHGAWPADSEETLRRKSGSRVLVDSGALLDELTSEAAISVLGDTLTLASSLPYTKYIAGRRDPVPEPDSGDVRNWADQVLGFLVTGHRR